MTRSGSASSTVARGRRSASYPLDRRWAASSFSQLLGHPELGGVWLAEHGEVVAGHSVLTVRYTMEHGALSGRIDDLFVPTRSTEARPFAPMRDADGYSLLDRRRVKR